MSTITIDVIHPWTEATIPLDISALSWEQLDEYAVMMDDELCERLRSELSPCTPAEFLRAWVAEVGPEEAGWTLADPHPAGPLS
jgi:hypothetical protein